MMYKSINYWTFGPSALEGKYDVFQAMEEAKKVGFDGIELCLATSGQVTFNMKEAKCQKIADAAKKIGIKISGVATGVYWGCSATSPKKSEQAKAAKYTAQALQVTKWLGTDAFLYIPGTVKPSFIPDAPVVPYGDVYETAVKQAKAACKIANNLNFKLCCGNLWIMFLCSPIEMRDFIKTVGGGANLGCYFDPANVVENGFADHWIPVLKKMIKRVHVKDYVKGGGFPEGFEVPIGKGSTNWPVIIKQLQAIKYNGPLTAEIISFTEDPKRVARISKEMDGIMSLVKK